jgi:O-antigen ligase
MLMFNMPDRPLLPPPLGGRVQLSDLLFPLAVAPWLVAGLPGLRRVAPPAGVPVSIWVSASVVTAAVAVLPGAAWRETAIMAYLGVVMVWGAAVLAEPGHLRVFARWWVVIVAAVVLVGLVGWLAAVLSGRPSLLIEWKQGIPVFGDRARIRSTLAPTSRLLITLLIVALPAIFALRRQDEPGARRWSSWLLSAMTVCAVLTYARGLFEFLLIMGLLALLPWRGRRRALAAVLVAVYLVALLGVVAVSTWRVTAHDMRWEADRSRSLGDGSYYGTMPDVGVQTLDLHLEWVHANRFVLKRMAWHAFLERPLTGWGPDGWPAIRARAHELGIAPPQVRFASAHSEILGVAAEMGAIGLVALTAFWLLVLRAMRAGSAEGFAGTLARYQALATVGVLLTSLHLDVMRFRFLWISLALGIAAAICAREESPA